MAADLRKRERLARTVVRSTYASDMRLFHWAALAFLIGGARLWTISVYGSPLPILDQWDVEGGTVLRDWFNGRLTLASFFEPHNEHRPVCTKILSLLLVLLNGQWDSQFEMVVNSLFFTGVALALAAAVLRLLGREFSLAALVAVGLWVGLPYGQENTLWGSQSQFYFLIGFSLLTIWGLGLAPAGSLQWFAGLAGAVLALLSMASGFLASAAVTIPLLLQLRQRPIRWQSHAITTTIIVLVIIAGLQVRLYMPAHDPLHATTVFAWLKAFARCLAWPFDWFPVLCALIYLPVALLAFVYVKQRRDMALARPDQAVQFLLALAGWVLLQAAVIAYGRGGSGETQIVSRYTDVLALGVVVNALALCTFVARRGLLLKGLAAFWCAAIISGAGWQSHRELAVQRGRASFLTQAEQNLRRYVTTADRVTYIDSPHRAIPYPNRERLRELLDDPAIRSLLPAEIRAPLPVEKARDQGQAFIRSGIAPHVANPASERVWGSYSTAGPAAKGRMESAALEPALSYLRFEVAGQTKNTLSVGIRGEGDSRIKRLKVRPRDSSGWGTGEIAVPNGPVRILGEDESPGSWIGFREPREIGRWSVATEALLRRGRAIFITGVALSAICAAVSAFRLWQRRRATV